MTNETPAEYTPGPWRESDEVENHGTHWEAKIIGGGGGTVARVTSRGVHGPDRKAEMYANARLIAAAPALLEAAEILLHHHRMADVLRSDTAAPRVYALRAAIAQARGE